MFGIWLNMLGQYQEAFIFWWIISVVEKKKHNANCSQLGVKMRIKKMAFWTLTFPHLKKIDDIMFNGATAVLNIT